MVQMSSILGVLAILLGVLVMVFPLAGVFTASVITGLGILFLGIWFLVLSFGIWDENKFASIAYIILGVLAIVVGIGLFGNVLAFSFLAALWFYVGGFFLLITGILGFFAREGTIPRGGSGLMVLMGVVYIILGLYAFNPFYLAIIIGITLILDGVAVIFIRPQDVVVGE
ncbi:MAG TPA: DUF308 domain-containing protein [Methanobacteriaceae archaeon]|nr:DUF308 domain-containing protein [Methanobacteriaceae archaeon]